MPEQLFGNVSSTTLAAGITAVQSVITVTSSANFPASDPLLEQEFRAAFVDDATPPNILEFIAVTDVQGTSWTVTRQVEDASRFPAAVRSVGTRIKMVVTKGVLESFERRIRAVGHNVLDHGAVGNSSHNTEGVGADDTAAIQETYDAAGSASGFRFVVFPGHRTYRVTSSIEPVSGVYTIGYGAQNAAGTGSVPTIVWDGVEDGTVFDVASPSQNMTSNLYENVQIMGKAAPAGAGDYVGAADALIKFRPTGGNAAKLDTGTALRNVWLNYSKGDALQILGHGATNFWIQGGRWDQCGGYGIYMRIVSSSILGIAEVTWDSGQIGSRGFLHLDAQDPGTNNAFVQCHIDTVHTEASNPLEEIEPTGTDPADRRGLIVCTITPASGRVQHFLTLDNMMLLGASGDKPSHSLVLMKGGTPTQNKARLSLNGRNIRGFSGDGTGAIGERIPIGGIPSADKSPYTSGHYSEIRYWPGGTDLFSTETPRAYTRVAAP
jgi:hypothetical protein